MINEILNFTVDFLIKYKNVLIASVVFNMFLYRYIIRELVFERLCIEGMEKVFKHISSKYYLLTVGVIGGAKTSSNVMLTQYSELYKMNCIEDKLNIYKLHLFEYIDFVNLHEYIQKHYDLKKVYTEYDYRDFVIKYFTDQKLDPELLNHELSYDPFEKFTILQTLSVYIEYFYYQFFRSSHVLSNTTIISANTGNRSMPLMESLFTLYRTNELAYEKEVVIVEDEKGIVDNSRLYARLDKNSVSENDDGKDVHAMVSRHLGKGTVLILTIAQQLEDVTANRRRLAQGILESLACRSIYYYSVESWLLRSLTDFMKNS